MRGKSISIAAATSSLTMIGILIVLPYTAYASTTNPDKVSGSTYGYITNNLKVTGGSTIKTKGMNMPGLNFDYDQYKVGIGISGYNTSGGTNMPLTVNNGSQTGYGKYFIDGYDQGGKTSSNGYLVIGGSDISAWSRLLGGNPSYVQDMISNNGYAGTSYLYKPTSRGGSSLSSPMPSANFSYLVSEAGAVATTSGPTYLYHGQYSWVPSGQAYMLWSYQLSPPPEAIIKTNKASYSMG